MLLIDQLKQVYFDGELELIDTSRYFPKIMRKEFTVGLNLQTSGPDEPIDLFYACGSSLNWDGYCNKAVDNCSSSNRKPPTRSAASRLLWTIERKLAEDFARPIIFYGRSRPAGSPTSRDITLKVEQRLQRQPPGRHLARQIALPRIRRGGDRVKDWEDLRCAGP